MDKQHEQTQPKKEARGQEAYLNHGAPSLVAKDSPDDFATVAAKVQKRGSRR